MAEAELPDEPVLEPEREIVDAHHHLWERGQASYLLPQLLADARQGHSIAQTIYIAAGSMYRPDGPEAMRPVGEVEFAANVAALTETGLHGPIRCCAGIVGFADLMLGNAVEPVLDALEQAGGGRLRGIRYPVAWHDDEAVRGGRLQPALVPPRSGIMLSDRFRAGARQVAAKGLSLDVWAYHTQLGELADLARSLPALTIVVNHAGGPIGIGPYRGRRDEVLLDWKNAMARLAVLPNVHVKLGGLGALINGFDFEQRPTPPTSTELSEAWGPYLRTCIELFEPSRCLFESNFPVDKRSASYAHVWNALKRIAQPFSEDEKAVLFAGTARRLYRLANP